MIFQKYIYQQVYVGMEQSVMEVENMNYILQLQKRIKDLEQETHDQNVKINDTIEYCLSDKFRTDDHVNVKDIVARLIY